MNCSSQKEKISLSIFLKLKSSQNSSKYSKDKFPVRPNSIFDEVLWGIKILQEG